MTITQKQLETAQNIISDYRKKAKDIYDFEVEYIRFLY